MSRCQPQKACVPPQTTTAPRTDKADKSNHVTPKRCPLMEKKHQVTVFSFLLNYLWHILSVFEFVPGRQPLNWDVSFPPSEKQSIPCHGRLVLVSGCLRPLFCCGWQHMTGRAKRDGGEGVWSGSPSSEHNMSRTSSNRQVKKKKEEILSNKLLCVERLVCR